MVKKKSNLGTALAGIFLVVVLLLGLFWIVSVLMGW